jgi:hypothetical protein
MRTARYYSLFLGLALTVFSAADVAAQKCSYDTKGFRDIPGANMVVGLRRGNVRTLKGTITGPNGVPIAKAALALFKITPGSVEHDKTFIGSTEADENGEYCFGTLPRGRYVLHAGTAGFQRTELEFRMVSSGNPRGKSKVDIQLVLGF